MQNKGRGLGHELPVVMPYAQEPKELTQVAVKPVTTTPVYPLDVFIHEGPAAWPCLEDPSCGLNGSSSKYGVFQNFLKFAESFKPAGVVVPTAEGEEEEEVPFITFDPFECVIPVQGKPSDILNSGFRLTANVLLPAPSVLVFGIRWGGVDFILGYDEAACFQSAYPCSGTLQCVWNIGEEPTLAEFFAMLGEEEVPAPGEYEYAWITGYHIGEEIIITDVLPAVLRVDPEAAEEEGIPWGLLLSGGTIAVGSVMML